MTVHDRILHRLRQLSPNSTDGPTIYDWRAARRSDPTAYPREETVRLVFGNWAAAVRAAGLTPRTTRRKGDQDKHLTQAEVDALLAEEFPGWTPGPDSAHYLREALLGTGGLTVARVIAEPVWDWHRMEQKSCTRYLLR